MTTATKSRKITVHAPHPHLVKPAGGERPDVGALTASDQSPLESFRRKIRLVEDRTRGVADRTYTGVYVVGRPGTLKTTTVRRVLEELGVSHLVRNARMSALGLFETLRENREHVIVLDDINALLHRRDSVDILLAALDGAAATPRRITYRTKDELEEFDFQGGIIAIGNLALGVDDSSQALRSRIHVLEHEPTEEELIAAARERASEGYGRLTADDCREALEFLVSEVRRGGRRFDLRTIEKAYADRLQWENRRATTHWHDLIRSSLQQAPDRQPLAVALLLDLLRSRGGFDGTPSELLNALREHAANADQDAQLPLSPEALGRALRGVESPLRDSGWELAHSRRADARRVVIRPIAQPDAPIPPS